MEVKFKCCAFCGSENVALARYTEHKLKPFYEIACCNCPARMRFSSSACLKECAKIWNRRAAYWPRAKYAKHRFLL